VSRKDTRDRQDVDQDRLQSGKDLCKPKCCQKLQFNGVDSRSVRGPGHNEQRETCNKAEFAVL